VRQGRVRRRRGVFLSDGGLRRVHDAVRRMAVDRDGARVSLEALSAGIGVSTRSLSRALNRASAVDFRTLEALFIALRLVPTEADYYYASYSAGKSLLRAVPEQMTRLVGRDGVLDVLDNLLRASRLLTLTGMGGIGKTRLAVELARRRQAASNEHVWFLEFTTGMDFRECIVSVATALEVSADDLDPHATIADPLNGDAGLLVLDNCDGVTIELGASISRLLRASPSLRIVVTSRETFGIDGECVYRVPVLPTPDNTMGTSATEAMRYPAVALFTERALARNPAFNLTDGMAQLIVQIVRNLDGLPLAIELAAARAAEMSPADLFSYLQQHLNDLEFQGSPIDPRHRSMRALMDWSFERLSDHERIVYSRAAVFRGSFDAAALCAVCCDVLAPEAVLLIAFQLSRKSILEINVQETPTLFSLMRTVREYARARLQESPFPFLSDWYHALHFLQKTADLMRPVREEGRTENITTLVRNFADVRSALEWSFANSNEHIGAALVSELTEYWETRGEYSAGERWIRRALAIDPELMTQTTKALLYEGLALMLHRQVRLEEAAEAAARSVSIYHEQRDDLGVCRVQNVLGNIDYDADNMESARNRFVDNLKRGQRLNPRVAVAALLNLGRIERDVDRNHRGAIARFEKSLRIARDLGREIVVALSLAELGDTYASLGNLFRASDFTKRSMEAFSDLGNDPWYCRQALKAAIWRIRAVGIESALPEVKTALDALLTDSCRSELHEQLDVIAELLLDDAKTEQAVILLTVTATRHTRTRPASAAAARLNRELLRKARGVIGAEAFSDISTRAREMPIETAFRKALISPYEAGALGLVTESEV
jgi:predicted ATPase